MFVLNSLWTLVSYAVPFFIVLTVVVFVHELGHFLVGRWCGVKIDAFSLGFGPEIFGFTDRYGTRWRFAAYPLGGYVKFHGDANGASAPDSEGVARMSEAERRLTLPGQPIANRAAIVAAGPFANFILTILIFSGLAYFYGQTILQPRVAGVVAGSAAEEAGFKAGDMVVRMDGRSVASFSDVSRAVMSSAGIPIRFEVERAGAAVTIEATPRVQEEQTKIGLQRYGRLGLEASRRPEDLRYETYGLGESLGQGVAETWYWVENTGTSVKRLFAGKASADQLSGPIRIAQISGELAKVSIADVIRLIAILSVSIGLLNLAPIPLLDGGHLLFYACEALRGRPLSERVQEIGFRFGLATVGALMLFALSNDILNIIRDFKLFPIG